MNRDRLLPQGLIHDTKEIYQLVVEQKEVDTETGAKSC